MNRVAGRAGIALVFVLILLGGLLFFVGEYVFQADDWINAPGSPHVYNAGNLGCGQVTDRSGVPLLDMTEERTYADSYALRCSTIHWLGDREGNISAPALPGYTEQLLGFDLFNGIYSYGGRGGQIVLSLSADVQKAAVEAMDGRKGTVAVYNYKTGELLCALTSPNYDPDDVPDIEGDTTGDYEGAYLNRFTQVSYVPGSIFKILTASAAVDSMKDYEDWTFTCDGSYLVDGNEVTCEDVHGEQTLGEALTNSCNCAFAALAEELGPETLEHYVQAYHLTESVHFDHITTAEGHFDLTDATPAEIAWSAIGQHTVECNPARFLTFMGMIAGGGTASEPHLVNQVSSGDKVTYQAKPVPTGQLMDRETAARMQTYLRDNVINKYGDENFPGLTVCAKSGTAERGGDLASNAMFAGFVADDAYPLAFFVAVEGGGYGRYTCVPIISSILQTCRDVMDRE